MSNGFFGKEMANSLQGINFTRPIVKNGFYGKTTCLTLGIYMRNTRILYKRESFELSLAETHKFAQLLSSFSSSSTGLNVFGKYSGSIKVEKPRDRQPLLFSRSLPFAAPRTHLVHVHWPPPGGTL